MFGGSSKKRFGSRQLASILRLYKPHTAMKLCF